MTEPSKHLDTTDVRISPIGLDGILGLPPAARGLVLFAHGSGSGRLSPRNNYVAAALRGAGGRPDMAAPVLGEVRAPTLLIVVGDDVGVLELNEQAYALLRCEKRLEIVPGATHLFEEPGALDQVIELARQWLTRHLTPRSPEG